MEDARNSETPMTVGLTCPRCAGVTLVRSPESPDQITFFECHSCYRRYAKKPQRALTYRWLHPLTLPLYSVIFDDEPVLRAESIAAKFVEDCSRDELVRMADEIELELNHPTQPVRKCLDNRATEEKCREYLQAFVSHVRSHLGRTAS